MVSVLAFVIDMIVCGGISILVVDHDVMNRVEG